MNDGSGDDETGNNNGTWTNTPTTITGKVGNAQDLNNTAYLTVTKSSDIDFTGNFSISLWVRFASTSGADHIVSRTDSTQDGYVIYRSGTGLYFGLRTATGYSQYNTTVTTGTWYHIVATWNGTTMTMYKDTVSAASGGRTGTLSAPYTNDLAIGDNPASPGGAILDGDLDDVRFYSRVLTSGEIYQLYDLGAVVSSSSSSSP